MKIFLSLLFMIFFFVESPLCQNKNLSVKNIEFSYKRILEKYIDSSFYIKCKIHNKSKDTIFILSNSCYGLVSNLILDMNSFQPYYMWFCNASFPICISIEPDQSRYFELSIKVLNEEKTFELGFNLKLLDKNYNREELNQLSNNKELDYYYEDIIILDTVLNSISPQ